jgi:hypothetical protein
LLDQLAEVDAVAVADVPAEVVLLDHLAHVAWISSAVAIGGPSRA